MAIESEMINRLNAAAVSRRDVLGLMAGAAGSAAAPGFLMAQETPKKGGTLRVSAFTNPSSLDPATGGAGWTVSYIWALTSEAHGRPESRDSSISAARRKPGAST